MSERYWHLKGTRVFSDLPLNDLRRLEAVAQAKWFAPNSQIYLPAESATRVFLLAEGRVRICSATPDGKRVVLAYIDPGELFGELSLVGVERREDLAEAMDKSLVISMPRDEFVEVMNTNLQLAIGIAKLVGLRRQRIERRLKSLLFRSVRQRLASLLYELWERYGKAAARGRVIDLRLSHQELASAIGSTRESVTLLLGLFTAEKTIEKQRNRIAILAPDVLRKDAESEGETLRDAPKLNSTRSRKE